MKIKVLLFSLLVVVFSCNSEKKGKVLLVVPDVGFNYPELAIPVTELRRSGYDIVVTNVTGEESMSLQNRGIKSDLMIDQVNSEDYLSISIIGGIGAEALFNNRELHNLLIDFNNEGKIISTQCLSGIILGNAGLLDGKKITGWPTTEPDIIKKGGIFTGDKSTRDGNIISGAGCPADGDINGSVAEFTARYIEALDEKI